MPSAGDTILNSIKQNVGITEKAVIEVIDLTLKSKPQKEGAPEVAKKSVGDSMAVKANMATGNSMANQDMLVSSYVDMKTAAASRSLAEKVKAKTMTNDQYYEKLKQLSDQFRDDAEKNKAKYANAGRKYFTVQFNPSSLQLSGHAGGLVQKLSYDKEDKDKDGVTDKSAQYTEGSTTIIMSVSLLFDSCDPQAAFLDDKISTNLTNVGKGIAKGIMQGTGNKKTSIQTEVEGFIAALRNPNTRLMTVNWGNICYTGVLRSVGATYTMFNPNGEPVRATVDLSMVCADNDQWPNTLKVWQLRYATAFEKGSESFVKVGQKVGSLLNL